MKKHYILLPALLVFGGITGILFGHFTKPTKEYPVTVQCYWETKGYQSYPTFECDSIKGDTCFKDGNVIITKNIINVSFN
jgi:hypothetical protein